MSEYILSCCSTADLSKEYFESRNIHYICFHYMLGDKSYPDDLGQSVPFDEFYARMAAGEMTKTSQVNVDEFAAYFEGFLKEGKDILHVSPQLHGRKQTRNWLPNWNSSSRAKLRKWTGLLSNRKQVALLVLHLQPYWAHLLHR